MHQAVLQLFVAEIGSSLPNDHLVCHAIPASAAEQRVFTFLDRAPAQLPVSQQLAHLQAEACANPVSLCALRPVPHRGGGLKLQVQLCLDSHTFGLCQVIQYLPSRIGAHHYSCPGSPARTSPALATVLDQLNQSTSQPHTHYQLLRTLWRYLTTSPLEQNKLSHASSVVQQVQRRFLRWSGELLLTGVSQKVCFL